MPTTTPARIALVLGIGAAALLARPALPPWVVLLAIGFGAFNVFADLPGTGRLRAIAVAGTVVALMLPSWLSALLAVIGWLIWIPMFALAYTAALPDDSPSEATRARLAVAVLIVAVSAGVVAYRLVVAHNLEQTAALFIGIPALAALTVVFGVSPGSATGVACKAVTIGLLVAMLFLWEGMLCVLMSAPLFYAVAISISQHMERRRENGTITLRSCAVLLVILPMTLEGVTAQTTFNRDETVTITRTIAASSDAVGRALFEAPRFNRARPLLLRAGFPSPVATRIQHRSSDTRWVIAMRGGEMLLSGMEPRTGDLTLTLEEARPGLIKWRAVSDTSHMTHFLLWRDVVVQWEAVDAKTTRVRWTVHYVRGLDPAWYFGPMERYAVRLAAGYLIDTVATP